MPNEFDLVGQQWQRKIIVLVVVLLGICLLMATGSMSPEADLLHEVMERSGVLFIMIGILGRTWCSLYIGGYKLSRLATDGPYSLTRNPLYVFSAIAAFGLGAQLGSFVFALLCAGATIAIFLLVISHEERALAERFPVEYPGYKAKVPRFFPAFRGWHDTDELPVRPGAVYRTFWDAMFFALAVPGLKALESLREVLLPTPLFRFY